MGSFIQEIFQGRGDKKRQGFWLKRSLLIFLVVTWLGLQIDFPITYPILWFSAGSIICALYSTLHFLSKRADFQIEFLFSLALFYAGITQALNITWLKMVYFPFIIAITTFYEWSVTVPLSFLIAFLELQLLPFAAPQFESIAFAVSLMSMTAISSFVFNKLQKEKDRVSSALETIKDTAREIAPETQMESLGSDDVISHYFASILKTDEEIKELLIGIKKAVFAESVNFFVPRHNSFILRCSTEKKGDIIVTGNGIISKCIKDKKQHYDAEINDKRFEIGYIKKGRILSLLAVPVIDEPTVLGVLTIDSQVYNAFSEPQKNMVTQFTHHLVRILERERIYPKLKRHYNGLKILNEESSKLVSSLDINIVAEKLCEGGVKIASSQVFFFLSKGRQFELAHYKGTISENKKQFDLKGTFIGMAVENPQPLYVSDASNYPIPIMPFKVEDVRSVIVVSLRYENKLLGLFAMLSSRKDFLDTFQRELLKVMCNQASTSIANAQLHKEIEKLAATDGLTGLYNHRVFQEKLSEELKRVNRYSEPTSLLLADIDFFKKINDAYGHPIGDLVLRDVAKIIRETIRDIDISARYGGEEFAVILPQTDGNGAKIIAERLRKTVMDSSFSADGRSFKITLSIGIATSPPDAKRKEELIEKTDKALYYAKHNGRNQSVLWREIRE